MMKNEFESILEKARKLQAMMAPGSGATGGEKANALALLERLLLSKGLTMQDLLLHSDGQRERRGVLIAPTPHWQNWSHLPWKPRQERGLITLAIHSFWYAVGESIAMRDARFGEEFIPWRAPAKRKAKRTRPAVAKNLPIRLETLSADMTKLEFEEWSACFYHYAPDFIEGLESVRAAQRKATRAVSKFAGVFVNEFHLFGPDSLPSEHEISREDLEAMWAAAGHVQGNRWERPAARLADEFLLEG